MGRTKEDSKKHTKHMVRIHIEMDAEAVEAVDVSAAASGMSRSEWIRQVVREKLERMGEAVQHAGQPDRTTATTTALAMKPRVCVECAYWKAPEGDSGGPWWVGTCTLKGITKNDFDDACPEGALSPEFEEYHPAYQTAYQTGQDARPTFRGYCFQCKHFKADGSDVFSLVGKCTLKNTPVDGAAELCEDGKLDPELAKKEAM